MASLCMKDDSYYVVFYREKKRQPLIYLRNIKREKADKIKGHIEDLIAAKGGGVSVTAATSAWLTKIDSTLSEKLAKAGLIDEPKAAIGKRKLGPFIDSYLTSRTDIKHWTKTNCESARRNLVNYFGEARDMATITPGDADDFRRDLLTRLSENTVRRHCGRAKQFFRAAVRKKLIAENPFADMKDCGVKGNRERDYFITQAEAAKVLAACPNAQWRLVFALSRFGGLRCPSEHSWVRVADVNFTTGKMKIRSPKTEHHEGKESRVVPIFPELRPYLEAAITELPKGAEYVVTLSGVVRCRGCDSPSNLGTQMARIIKRAGLTPWPKLFHNLRATRQTELAANHPAHVVCEWIGNTPKVAREHYLRVTDADFAKANGGLIETGAAQEYAPEDAQTVSTRHGKKQAQEERLLEIVRKALEIVNSEQATATVGNLRKSQLVPRVGLEPTTY